MAFYILIPLLFLSALFLMTHLTTQQHITSRQHSTQMTATTMTASTMMFSANWRISHCFHRWSFTPAFTLTVVSTSCASLAVLVSDPIPSRLPSQQNDTDLTWKISLSPCETVTEVSVLLFSWNPDTQTQFISSVHVPQSLLLRQGTVQVLEGSRRKTERNRTVWKQNSTTKITT